MIYPSKDLGFPLLQFLWKWKVATTTALAIKFFPNSKPESAHRRLLELSRGGYIRSLTSHTGRGCVWTLTDKGFAVVRDSLCELREVGYKSEAIGHDLLSMAAMLGDWLTSAPSGVEVFSEQEMRRYPIEFYPMWVPQNDHHRADGYWRLPKLNEDCSVALEIERTQKSLKKYDLVADFYDSHDFVKSVIWIAPIHGCHSSINNRIKKNLSQTSTKHLFIPLSDFMTQGWQAKIAIGRDCGKTLSECLVAFAAPPQRTGDSLAMLETRKKPVISKPTEITTSHGFFN